MKLRYILFVFIFASTVLFAENLIFTKAFFKVGNKISFKNNIKFTEKYYTISGNIFGFESHAMVDLPSISGFAVLETTQGSNTFTVTSLISGNTYPVVHAVDAKGKYGFKLIVIPTNDSTVFVNNESWCNIDFK
jgi:hypothetical protein